jgi:hypothetical protein
MRMRAMTARTAVWNQMRAPGPRSTSLMTTALEGSDHVGRVAA